MVTAAGSARRLALRDPSIAAALEHFELLIGKPDQEQKLGQLHAFGKYWLWSQSFAPGSEPLRLFEWTPAGVADLTTEHYSLHAVYAGTPHCIEGLFGYWLISDTDHVWFQVPTPDGRYYVLLAGGRSGVNRRHSIEWRCQQCGVQLGEKVDVRHDGTPEGFLAAQAELVQAFNQDEARRRCASCGVVHPETYGFRSSEAKADLAQDYARRVQEAFGDLQPRPAAWNGPAAKLAELSEERALVVQVGKRQIALLRDGTEVRAISATCPHYGGPLALGQVRHGEIVCPWHRFRFDLATGRSVTNPNLCAPTYEVRLEGDDVVLAGPQRRLAED